MRPTFLKPASPMHAILALLALAASLASLTSCSDSNPPASAKPVVVTTVFAYYDALRAIGADTIEAHLLIPPNESPHEYQLTSEDKLNIARAALFIDNGMGLDERFEKAIDNPAKTTILTLGKTIPSDNFLKTYEVPLDDAAATRARPASKPADEPAPTNPHIWLNPKVQMLAAEQIRDALSKLNPKDRAVYELNANNYIRDIHDLDQQFAEAAATFATTEFIGFHSAYDYLAHRYGLKQVASIEEIPGEGLTPDQAQRIISLINDHHIKYVAIENALEPRGMDLVKSKTGVQTVVLQPLETYDRLSDTYTSLMTQNLESLKKALGTKPPTMTSTKP